MTMYVDGHSVPCLDVGSNPTGSTFALRSFSVEGFALPSKHLYWGGLFFCSGSGGELHELHYQHIIAIFSLVNPLKELTI